MNQREFWDGVAATKTFSHPFDRARFSALVDPAARVLDYGCGYGRVCRELRDAGYRHVHGVDMSSQMIARARAELPDLMFDVLDGPALSAATASFDAIVLFSVLTCIPDDEGQRALVGELARVLRPGGILYVSDLLLQHDERNRARYHRRPDALRHAPYGTFELEPGTVFRHLARGWIDDLLSPFDRVEFLDVPVTTMNGNPACGFQYFGRRRQL